MNVTDLFTIWMTLLHGVPWILIWMDWEGLQVLMELFVDKFDSANGDGSCGFFKEVVSPGKKRL